MPDAVFPGPETIPLKRRVRGPGPPAPTSWRWSVAAAGVALALLIPVQAMGSRPMLLAERFRPGAGWVQVALLAAYAAFLMDRTGDPRRSGTWRRRSWTLFSAVFFGQLLLGLLVDDRFLMSGRLHVPVPAVIVGGPVYRGEGLFMPILLGATMVLAGPAWCSHLCYVGAWDSAMASLRRRPGALPAWRGRAQAGFLGLTVAAALVLRWAGASPGTAAAAGGAFGIAGVGVMAFASRKRGAMVHCTTVCPVGWVATRLGRVSPFRLRLDAACHGCGACATACRYGALDPDDIRARRPGPGCTLCGDCVKSCHDGFAAYRFPGLGPAASRALFLVIVTGLQAAFLGVARL